ncbi:MAG: hypothetical protein ACPIOQ_82225 [Promethearchaeia archaeon]
MPTPTGNGGGGDLAGGLDQEHSPPYQERPRVKPADNRSPQASLGDSRSLFSPHGHNGNGPAHPCCVLVNLGNTYVTASSHTSSLPGMNS